ncbi:nodulation efficiency protein D [Aliarcobacter trophiarum LMG 25534]|uniref:Membrane protein n=1 Tax=Aliarcobacter trophiarum LMG 25534 TaxID=1032241 RepID=A0AAD0VMN3_9BACT|nr:NfeD family protein [Aliarcobacter trophiarum]AXK49081.1 putative membrane protein [Aliarcobacter trophiarum LMG 25534]RXI28225.1 nodulation efficiency protein D [Aliarcobacter trophiarum]RXJ90970.1 nodulation efficiency protein D [Aliarcobacter trophiarum LMG 25534]
MLSAMDFYTFIAIGVVLVALEVFLYSFITIWFGLGFIFVGFISIFYNFPNLYAQLGLISVFSLLFLLFFRKLFLKRFSKSQKEISDNFFNSSGVGEFKQGKVFYKGTFWELDPSFDKEDFKTGEKVKVLKIDKNIAFIEKI